MLARLSWMLLLLSAIIAGIPREPIAPPAERPPKREAALPPLGVKWQTVVIADERTHVGWVGKEGRHYYCEMSLSAFRVEARRRQPLEGD